MYFPDLSPYQYLEREAAESPALNVGWLDLEHDYPKGEVSAQALERLRQECSAQLVNHMRGWHACEFCRPGFFKRYRQPTIESSSGKPIMLGSAEIRVKGKDGKVYAAPNLIYHYVEKHQYRPPEEFLEALLNG
jgi:hypothetical protein